MVQVSISSFIYGRDEIVSSEGQQLVVLSETTSLLSLKEKLLRMCAGEVGIIHCYAGQEGAHCCEGGRDNDTFATQFSTCRKVHEVCEMPALSGHVHLVI